MNEAVPWAAPAVVDVKHRGHSMYHPVVAGLTLNAALEYAIDPDIPVTTKLRILVNWGVQKSGSRGAGYGSWPLRSIARRSLLSNLYLPLPGEETRWDRPVLTLSAGKSEPIQLMLDRILRHSGR